MKITLNGQRWLSRQQPDFADVQLDVDISVEIDTNQAQSQHGYSRSTVDVKIDDNDLKDAASLLRRRSCGLINIDA